MAAGDEASEAERRQQAKEGDLAERQSGQRAAGHGAALILGMASQSPGGADVPPGKDAASTFLTQPVSPAPANALKREMCPASK